MLGLVQDGPALRAGAASGKPGLDHCAACACDLAATEGDLTRIQAAVTRCRDPLRGTAEIALALAQ